jgi:hypothetical protein
MATELDDGVVLIKDEETGEPIGLELLSHRPGDARFDSVNVEIGGQSPHDRPRWRLSPAPTLYFAWNTVGPFVVAVP